MRLCRQHLIHLCLVSCPLTLKCFLDFRNDHFLRKDGVPLIRDRGCEVVWYECMDPRTGQIFGPTCRTLPTYSGGPDWKDVASYSSLEASTSITGLDQAPLHLTYFASKDKRENLVSTNKRNMGCFLILIFLPPRFHLLFQMEVCDVSTLVRIRTDHWPCLAYIDD
jgi:hypothetical protein